MKCDADCGSGEEASIFFSFLESGKVKSVNLCKHCAKERGIDDPMGYSLMDMLQGMGEETSTKSMQSKTNELTCEACGFTQSDFKKTGRFGCAKCYEVFSEGLESLLEAMHKNTEHIGKVPSLFEGAEMDGEIDASPPIGGLIEPELDELSSLEKFDLGAFDDDDENDELTSSSVTTSIAILKDKLDIAVSEEDYEEAARLRDEIAKLEKGTLGEC